MVVVVGIIVDVVFGIVITIVVVVVVICEGPTLNPAIRIIIVGFIDKAKGPIILERRIMVVVVGIIINVVFGIVIAVVVVIVIVDCEGPPLLSLTLSPVVRIIVVGDKAKGPIIGGDRGLDTAVGTVIVMQ